MSETTINLEPAPAVTTNAKNQDLFGVIQHVTSACYKGNVARIQNIISKSGVLQNLGLVVTNGNAAPTLGHNYKRILRTSLLRECYELCTDDNDRLFFAAATFNSDILSDLIRETGDREFINQARRSDSVLTFVLKYGDISDENFLKCMKLLIDSGVEVNKPDFFGRFAIDFVPRLYEESKGDERCKHDLLRFTAMLVEKGVVRSEAKTTTNFVENHFGNVLYEDLDDKNRLFYWLAKSETKNLVRFPDIRNYLDCDNGENTLLQFAVKKSNQEVAHFLLQRGADPGKTAKFNPVEPLQFFVREPAIFKKILEHKNIQITQMMFDMFVDKHSEVFIKQPEILKILLGHRNITITQQIFNKLVTHSNLKIFNVILEYNKLDPNFRYEGTGNTPLHYAILFGHKYAIQRILKSCPTAMHVQNSFGKTPLELINAKDFENYLNSCFVLDKFNTNFSARDYKIHLRFEPLIFGDEIETVFKIAQIENLQHLLTHPLVFTFIDLKWKKTQLYFLLILLIQALIFLTLSASLFHFADSTTALVSSITIIIVNVFLKLFLIYGNIKSLFFSWPFCWHYGHSEILLFLIISFSFAFPVCRAFDFVLMSLIFLTTAGYHPKIAKISVMFQTVFRTFISLVVFFSVVIFAFAASFYMLFKETSHQFFSSFWRSVFITYVMTTGEFNTNEMPFDPTASGKFNATDGSSQIVEHSLFLIFTLFVSLFVVNFFIGAAVTDMERIEADAEIIAIKNVIVFLRFVQNYIYNKSIFKSCLPTPLLFSEGVKKRNYNVNFYVKKKNQFKDHKDFPASVSKECFNKIEKFYLNMEVRQADTIQ